VSQTEVDPIAPSHISSRKPPTAAPIDNPTLAPSQKPPLSPFTKLPIQEITGAPVKDDRSYARETIAPSSGHANVISEYQNNGIDENIWAKDWLIVSLVVGALVIAVLTILIRRKDKPTEFRDMEHSGEDSSRVGEFFRLFKNWSKVGWSQSRSLSYVE